jgi:hypothetical protein
MRKKCAIGAAPDLAIRVIANCYGDLLPKAGKIRMPFGLRSDHTNDKKMNLGN